MEQSGGELPGELHEQLVARLQEAPVRLALLFGSCVTGDATSDSDVDIAVAYDSSVTSTTDTHLTLVADLTRILGRDDIDVVRLTAVDPRIAVEALDTGELLVGSSEERDTLRNRFDTERRERQDVVQTQISEAERAIERRIEQREHG